MNIFKREKISMDPTPVVPPRPTKEELERPIMHSQTPSDAGVTSGSDENTSDPTTRVRKKPFFFSSLKSYFSTMNI